MPQENALTHSHVRRRRRFRNRSGASGKGAPQISKVGAIVLILLGILLVIVGCGAVLRFLG